MRRDAGGGRARRGAGGGTHGAAAAALQWHAPVRMLQTLNRIPTCPSLSAAQSQLHYSPICMPAEGPLLSTQHGVPCMVFLAWYRQPTNNVLHCAMLVPGALCYALQAHARVVIMAACGRVHPATRLGWTRNRGAYQPLGAVRPDGGIVPRTLVVIQRRLQVKEEFGNFG